MKLVYAFLQDASGRAKCQLCNEKIAKGLKAVKFEAFRASGQVHRDSKICDELRVINKL